MNRLVTTVLLAACSLPVAGQTGDAPALRWQAQASVLAASGTRDLDDSGAQASAYLRGQLDGAYGPLAARVQGWLAPANLGLPSTLYLTQGWVEAAAGPLRLRAGRQVVNWGRTDRLNPTDSLSPRSLRMLHIDTADERLGADMLTLDAPLGAGWRLSAHHVPHLRADDLPRALTGGQTITPDGPPGRGSSQALKLDRTGAGLDGSISAFDGPATMPVATLGATGLAWTQLRRRVLGADLSWAMNEQFSLRAEIAAARIAPASRTLANAAGVAGSLWLVVGLERPLPGGWLATVSASLRRNETAPEAPGRPEALQRMNRNLWFQSAPRDDALVLSLTRSPFEGDWSVEAALVRGRAQAGALQARLAYRIDDTQSLHLGVQFFRGPDSTSLGSLRRNSLALLEWRIALMP